MFHRQKPITDRCLGINKPFKPPRINKNGENRDAAGFEKRVRLDQISSTSNFSLISKAFDNSVRSGSEGNAVSNCKRPKVENSTYDESYCTRYFMVLYRKKTVKKHKSWDGDGVLLLRNGYLSLKRDSGDGSVYVDLVGGARKSVNVEDIISLGQYEVEVDYEVTERQELAGLLEKLSCRKVGKLPAKKAEISNSRKEYVDNNISGSKISGSNVYMSKSIPVSNESMSKRTDINNRTSISKSINNETFISKMAKKPVVSKHFGMAKRPMVFADSLVMDRVEGEEVVDVVVDPLLAKRLRPHQREGVKFLYNSVMGINGGAYKGALLADEMGLGKTLMTIALIWTLLKQSPHVNQASVIKKVLVVAPVTLLGNWKKEFKKWLDVNRIGILSVGTKYGNDTMSIKMFGQTRVHQVMLLGYEKLVALRDLLVQSRIQFDLLVCDEGHRLKSGTSKALQALNTLQIERKVLLSGTPIQNDLEEFYTLIHFINPGVLGLYSEFQKTYMKPILRSREPNCRHKDVLRIGKERSDELIQITKGFILRRTSEILDKFLPPRTDLVIFVRPTQAQIDLFEQMVTSKQFLDLDSGKPSFQTETLAMINLFKKACNCPLLAQDIAVYNSSTVHTSGKLLFLIKLLVYVRDNTNEKVVVVSNYTKTLDLIEQLVRNINCSATRLDGTTPSSKRDGIVSKFNSSSQESSFVFLLSSKAGGVGLNLIGASRLVLFDNDWNPSVDLQAMARIHRDGQKLPTFIYRLVTTGCIDEKIFQRQLMKINLSNKFLDDKANSKDDIFDYQDLKELFKLELNTSCNTHDLIECGCDGNGIACLDSSDDSDEEQTNQGWTSALQMSFHEDNGKAKKIKGCLKEYLHIDPAFLLSKQLDTCGDSVVDSIFEDRTIALTVSYLFAKVSK